MKVIIATLLLIVGVVQIDAQVGIGLTSSYDLYQYFRNPEDGTGQSRSAGSAMLNFGLGPKIWFGGEDFSFSVEGQASIGLLGLSLGDYKGLGVASIPLMAKLNFGGLSAMDREGRFGWSIGGGLQYSHTEIFYLKDDFEDQEGERNWYRTYIGQVGYGFGMSGFAAYGYVRGGYDSETKACNANLGIQLDFNFSMLNKIDDPASRL